MIYTVTLNPARDRSVVIENFAAGKVNRVLELRDDPGGKGINVSKVIRVLGGESVAMGILGGGTGEYIRNAVAEMGIAADFVFTDKETRTNIKISDPVNHETTDINEKGVISPEDAAGVLEKLLKRLVPGDSVVIAGKLDTRAVDLPLWISGIAAKGARVYLDTEGEALKTGVKCAPYLIKPNDDELSQLLGRGLNGIEDIISAAKAIIAENGVHTVAVSLGSRGAVFVTEKDVYAAEAVRVEAVSTVGAGDTVMASLAYMDSIGADFKDACALAIAAGAAAVTCPGTSSPSKELIDELLKRVELKKL